MWFVGGSMRAVFSPVLLVVALHHGPVGVSFAPLDHLASRVAEYLKHPVLAILVWQRSHLDALQGDDALGAVLSSVLEVVEATVVQDEPATLPALPAAALRRQRLARSHKSELVRVSPASSAIPPSQARRTCTSGRRKSRQGS